MSISFAAPKFYWNWKRKKQHIISILRTAEASVWAGEGRPGDHLSYPTSHDRLSKIAPFKPFKHIWPLPLSLKSRVVRGVARLITRDIFVEPRRVKQNFLLVVLGA